MMTDADNARAVAEASNRFAFDLYLRLANNEEYTGRNIFFSPRSLSSALALLYEGAWGTTADEIWSVSHLSGNNTVRRESFSGINAVISSGDPRSSVRTASAPLTEQTFPFLAEYVNAVEHSYDAKTPNLDFKGRPEDTRITINTWVAGRTGDRIRDLIPAGVIDPAARLVIEMADADFRTAPDRCMKVPMMQRVDEGAMPYEKTTGKGLSMVVVLPRSDNLMTTEASLSAGTLSALHQSAESTRVKVYFPKFTLKTRYFLPRILGVMGMPTAFSVNADFSGINGTTNLFVSSVIHKAFVCVNEEGTDPAAATAVGPMCYASENPEPWTIFRADYPFIFLIHDDESGTILFNGRVAHPAGGAGCAA